eukprot:gene27308-34005_t
MGLNLQYGLMRIMNISHGEFLMLGAFLTWSAYTLWGISPLLLMPLAFIALFALGVVVHALCFKRLAARAPNVDVFEARSGHPDVVNAADCESHHQSASDTKNNDMLMH